MEWGTQTNARLRAVVRAALEPLGYELVGVEQLRRHSDAGVVRVYIDKPGGGVSLDDCARASERLSAVLDVEDPMPGPYTLEVSSPGLDRPLFDVEQLRRFTGRRARVRLSGKLAGQRHFEGVLAGVEGERLRLEGEATVYELPVAMIERARLVPNWEGGRA